MSSNIYAVFLLLIYNLFHYLYSFKHVHIRTKYDAYNPHWKKKKKKKDPNSYVSKQVTYFYFNQTMVIRSTSIKVQTYYIHMIIKIQSGFKW